ncbi:hypothetical protein HGRIS_009639 [Hohenbuehelia grisea]|uniref:Uncharacterized protein n=1 Tax=Hohenbuehelia grisea TaxID=104357 RepID=A0ABR3J1S1_9AGAR
MHHNPTNTTDEPDSHKKSRRYAALQARLTASAQRPSFATPFEDRENGRAPWHLPQTLPLMMSMKRIDVTSRQDSQQDGSKPRKKRRSVLDPDWDEDRSPPWQAFASRLKRADGRLLYTCCWRPTPESPALCPFVSAGSSMKRHIEGVHLKLK